jgi:hypothetical protein
MKIKIDMCRTDLIAFVNDMTMILNSMKCKIILKFLNTLKILNTSKRFDSSKYDLLVFCSFIKINKSPS